jgi:hypothetical protein
MMLYPTIDAAGFVDGELSELAIHPRNIERTVAVPLPEGPLAPLHKWRWHEGAWTPQRDYRGETYYNPDNTDEEHRPSAWDDAPPAGWLRWVPGESKTVHAAEELKKARAAKWAQVKVWRAQARIAPLLHTRFGIFNADAEALENIKDTVAGLTAAMLIGAEPETIQWTMADENPTPYVTLTPSELREVGVMLLTRGYDAHIHSRELFEQIESAPLEALDTIVW